MNLLRRTGAFLEAITTGIPEFFSDNEIVYDGKAFKLRKFRDGIGTPVLIVPPEAGHHSSIADYDDGQSLVQTCLGVTEAPVFCVDWQGAKPGDAKVTIHTKVLLLLLAANIIGKPVHLVGLCQGGWLSAIFTAKYGGEVERLTIAGSPIDTHVGGGKLQKMVEAVPQRAYEAIVSANGGVMPGSAILAGWKMMNAVDRYFTDFVALWNATGDEEKTRKIKKFRTWYEYTQDLHGDWYLDAVDSLFRHNKLVNKKWVVLGEPVDLSRITCPVDTIVGAYDDITLPEQCHALLSAVATPEKDKRTAVISDCGHIGVFMGSKSQSTWAEIMAT